MKRTNLNISVCSEFRDIFLMVDFSTLLFFAFSLLNTLFFVKSVFLPANRYRKKRIFRALCLFIICVISINVCYLSNEEQ